MLSRRAPRQRQAVGQAQAQWRRVSGDERASTGCGAADCDCWAISDGGIGELAMSDRSGGSLYTHDPLSGLQ